jgi:hypothetical protein
VLPVAKIATTNIIKAKAAIEAPNIMKASCVGSTLKTNLKRISGYFRVLKLSKVAKEFVKSQGVVLELSHFKK